MVEPVMPDANWLLSIGEGHQAAADVLKQLLQQSGGLLGPTTEAEYLKGGGADSAEELAGRRALLIELESWGLKRPVSVDPKVEAEIRSLIFVANFTDKNAKKTLYHDGSKWVGKNLEFKSSNPTGINKDVGYVADAVAFNARLLSFDKQVTDPARQSSLNQRLQGIVGEAIAGPSSSEVERWIAEGLTTEAEQSSQRAARGRLQTIVNARNGSIELKIAVEAASVKAQSATFRSNYAMARARLGLPPVKYISEIGQFVQTGQGAIYAGKAENPTLNEQGKAIADAKLNWQGSVADYQSRREATDALALGLVNLMDQIGKYAEQEAMEDARQEAEKEQAKIRQKQKSQPAMGTLIALRFSGIDTTQYSGGKSHLMYEGLETYGAEDPGMARKNFEDSARFMEVNKARLAFYKYFTIWVPPLSPRYRPAAAPSAPPTRNEQVARAISLATETLQRDIPETYRILNGSPMYDILVILEAFASDDRLAKLKRGSTYGINQSRIDVAIAAVEYKRSCKLYGALQDSYASQLAELPDEQQRNIKDFMSSPPVAQAQAEWAVLECGYSMGDWKVQIGGWSGIFRFNQSKCVWWIDPQVDPKRLHKGTWRVRDGLWQWIFDEDPPDDKRIFTLKLPVTRQMDGAMLPDGHGFFSMKK